MPRIRKSTIDSEERTMARKSQAEIAIAADTSGIDWVTMQDAADIMKVDTSTIRRWIARGDIRARRFGPRLIRVDRSTLFTAGDPLVSPFAQAS